MEKTHGPQKSTETPNDSSFDLSPSNLRKNMLHAMHATRDFHDNEISGSNFLGGFAHPPLVDGSQKPIPTGRAFQLGYTHSPWKWMLGILLSRWEGLFSVDMLL